MFLSEKRGFTLIELLVVIGIIGLLASLSVVGVNNSRKKANDARRLSDIKQIQTALEMYYLEHPYYPPNSLGDELGTSQYGCLGNNGFNITDACSEPMYMGQIPVDPKSEGDYRYRYLSTMDSYTITFTLEKGVGKYEAGTVIAQPSGIAQ